jgi:hypothetical protein
VKGNPIAGGDPFGLFGPWSGAGSAVFELGTQLVGQVYNTGSIDLSSVNWADVAASGVMGCFLPSGLGALRGIGSSGGAIRALRSQAANTSNRARVLGEGFPPMVTRWLVMQPILDMARQ